MCVCVSLSLSSIVNCVGQAFPVRKGSDYHQALEFILMSFIKSFVATDSNFFMITFEKKKQSNLKRDTRTQL